jgi:MYXO-CTERM domain-containing protein
MKKFLAVCATAVLFTTLGLAQGTTSPQSSNDTQRQYIDDAPRHDYGWIGLLGLLGLSGLVRRRDTSNRNATEPRNIDSRRVA